MSGHVMKIKPAELPGAIRELLEDYNTDLADYARDVSGSLAKQAVSKVKAASPVSKNGKHKGDYRKGWRSTVQSTRMYSEAVVYNATDYQLTHLLEFGHANRDGGRTAARPHIATVNDEIQKEFEEKIVAYIEKGSK